MDKLRLFIIDDNVALVNMIKEYPIKLNNEAVTVVDVDGVSVQFPSINNNTVQTVKVDCRDDWYFIVDDESIASVATPKSKKKSAETEVSINPENAE